MERLPTPVFWTWEFYGLYSPWGRTESDTIERLSLSLSFQIKIIQISPLLWYYNFQTIRLYFYFLDFFFPLQWENGRTTGITSWLSQNKLINWHSYLYISVCELGYIKSACLTKLSKLNSLICYIKDHTKVLPFWEPVGIKQLTSWPFKRMY